MYRQAITVSPLTRTRQRWHWPMAQKKSTALPAISSPASRLRFAGSAIVAPSTVTSAV
ncbi:MAG: hypothetical protein U5L11_14335 [Arhodomonas sp.]|nr:hypothetical protein [Arhodomonas sp.]